MSQPAQAMIAACGLDCSACNLFLAKVDAPAAESLVGWFRQEGWLKVDEGAKEIMSRGPYCLGCHGDRSVQWSGDCWIRKCCVEEKHLRFCSECQELPCTRLIERAQGNPRYTAALDRLKAMRDGTCMGQDGRL
jgi:Protein of unknown function (DUF3795)